MSEANPSNDNGTLFGHPTGLFTLFFAEMWERFSYYGMRALLLYYMLKGFLKYSDGPAYTVYGSYTALVYLTPFFGGMIADRILGARRAVVLGGLLMAAGHLLMTIEYSLAFFTALALLIAGNGFFKPNISTMVGSLYPQGSPKRDGGFTIFYMGINLGAAMAPLMCGYIGETYGWHYGFGLATIGMLTGIAVFVAPTLVTQLLIMSGALAAAFGLIVYHPSNIFSAIINAAVALALLSAAVLAWVALGRGGLPQETGQPKDFGLLRRRIFGPLTVEWTVYAGAIAAVPILTLLVSGFDPVLWGGLPRSLIPDSVTSELGKSESGVLQVAGVVLKEISKPAGLVLLVAGVCGLLYLLIEAARMDLIARHRMFVILILTFFSMLFWSFFEQAGSSINNFTDRNVDRVFEKRYVTEEDIGRTVLFRIPLDPEGSQKVSESTDGTATEEYVLAELPPLTQEQLGHSFGNAKEVNQRIFEALRREEYRKSRTAPEEELPEKQRKKLEKVKKELEKSTIFTMTGLTALREDVKNAGAENDPFHDKVPLTLPWKITRENYENQMGIGGAEMVASVFQSVNPIYILLLGVAFSGLWTFLGTRGLEPNTPVKFSLGLLQLGLGFGAIWLGAQYANERGMVGLHWLLLGYLLHTTGELCLSPVGLSMVTKLSPVRLVSTVMGMWFLATAFSQFLAAIIAQFTGVGGHGEGEASIVPVPSETVHIYGHVFGLVALTAIGSAVFCFVLSPILAKWMHPGEQSEEDLKELA